MPAAGTKRYQALTPISVGSVTNGGKDRRAALIAKGEIVSLSEEQARHLLADCKVPVIRPVEQQGDPLPVIRARDLFGTRPRAQQFGAEPDPPGASQVLAPSPEGSDPQPDPETDPYASQDR